MFGRYNIREYRPAGRDTELKKLLRLRHFVQEMVKRGVLGGVVNAPRQTENETPK